MTIKKLSDYFRVYKHHPNFKSASEMEKDDGFNVSDMVMRLLRTVEEQSLYITQQDERMDKQEKMIKALEKKINKKAKVE